MGRSSKGRFRQIILVFLDIALVHAGYLAAYWLLNNFSTPFYDMNTVLWTSAVMFAIFYLFNLYTDWQRRSFQQVMYTIVLSLTMFTAFMLLAVILYELESIQLKVIISGFFIQNILLILSRFCMWHAMKAVHGKKKLLIIGEDENIGLSLAEKLLSHNKGWFTISGFLPLNEREKLEGCLKEIDVVLVSPSISEKQKSGIVSLCVKYGKEALIVPELFEIFVHGSVPQQVDDMLVLSIPPVKLNITQRMVKRIFDLMAAIVLLIFTSPITLLLWILIPLTSQGSAFFKQERIGRGGKPYQIYKFRSMVQDAEKNTGPVLAAERDPRITWIGRLIRATRLDELPQLYNVLKGDMSLIGPRPERSFFIDQFQKQIPDYAYRMAVKPGVTGLAQIMAKYTTTVEDKLRLDLMYIRQYSFATDMKILLQTIRVILQRDQASGVKERNHQREKQLLQLLGQK